MYVYMYIKNVYRSLSVVWRPICMVKTKNKQTKKTYVNVCAQKPFVYAFVLSVAHCLPLNTTTVQKHNTIS